MAPFNADKEAETLKNDLIRNPVLVIHEAPSQDDLDALDIVQRFISENAKVLHRTPQAVDYMVMPCLLTAQTSYYGLDDIRGLAHYIARIMKKQEAAHCA